MHHKPTRDESLCQGPELFSGAIRYAELGYRVFACKPGEKTPITQHGCKDATTDAEQIERWWTQWPGANIGLATDGLLVVDVDGQGNPWPGDPDKARELAQAPMSLTPRGGRHYFFRQPPGKAWRCTASKLAPGVDTRAGGGYVLVPPSIVNGKRYQFVPGQGLDVPPEQLPLPPAWLVARLDALGQASAVASAGTAADGEVIPEGQRNEALFKLGCKLRRDGLTPEAIEAALQTENAKRCQPPLPRDEVARIAASAGRYPPGEQKSPSVPQILPYCPPPLDVLPELIREYVSASARAIHCDPGYVLLPVLVTLAGAIGGNARRLELKPGWQVPPILWGAIVGESGTGKTPALQHVLRPIRKIQQQAFEHYDNLLKRYEVELASWEKAKAAWRSDKKTHEPPPEKPQPPVAERILVSDTTVEALAPILRENPRGVLLARDELAAWISSFDRYANKGRVSADAANWLSVFNAETITVDRKTGTHRTLHIPRAAVSVIGGIQPGILRRVLGREHREAGLLARLLLVWPPRKPLEWTEDAIPGRLEADFADLLQQLRELPLAIADNGEPRPLIVQLTPEAKALWVAFYNAHNVEQADLIGGLTSAWAKLEQYAARLALVIHYVRWAAGEVADELQLDRESMAAGIALTDWFKHETRRVYSRLDEAEQEQEQRELIEWIERRGGTVTAREVQANYRPLRKPGAAEVALDDLVQAGLGEWEQCPASPQGGRPTRQFRLLLPAQPADKPSSTPDGLSTNPPSEAGACQRNLKISAENGVSLTVDSVDSPQAGGQPPPGDGLSTKPPSEAGACQRNLKISAENGVSLTVDSVDSPQAGGQPPPGDGTPTKGAVRQPTLQATVTWLRTSLETGPQPVAELLKWWANRGYNLDLVYQAREKLGVIEYCLSPALGACWRLPD